MRVAMPLVLLVVASFALASPAPKEKGNSDGTVFLIQDAKGLAYLDPKGKEQQRVSGGNGALSLDGRWLACCHHEKGQSHSKVVILSRIGKQAPVVVPDVSVAVGEGFLPVWSADGGRLLIAQCRRARNGGGLENTFCVYDVATKKVTNLSLPDGHWITGWSKDGKRLLSTLRDNNSGRICWINADGKGEPEFLTPANESAWHPQLSPDERFILFKAPAGRKGEYRLYAMELATKKRVAIDEPGETHGYSWSAGGSRIAYTWQPTPAKGNVDVERKISLFTCDADGKNRKEITSRKLTLDQPSENVTIFFEVIAWR